ncbi:Voltage-dependent calcium channel subunit alpha-2/delta-4 [Channa argus]|uniref:Voltage-dependent calcium channel subunit alpha-2/delta-4 n=1 Tax=Channa argus TaxID=215402 RepID=A0A6G1QR85_CHAAH|nr:Voltage-dependent calcium channel subunit alpha-2/delta-4 [Channa argus]
MKESFRILNEATTLGQGSLCNQAIMLITDGAMEDFQDVFEEFNWPERRVRVFTYLIGREMTFAENVKWIACNNKGESFFWFHFLRGTKYTVGQKVGIKYFCLKLL